jgi:hypothetical protein
MKGKEGQANTTKSDAMKICELGGAIAAEH